MGERSPAHSELLGTRGGTYRIEILTGPDPLEEIESAADRLTADILVFGRHQMIHRTPFRLGHIPYQAMLRQKRAVMVVPMQ